MSYDLMVFDTKSAPRDKEEFLIWYKKQVTWESNFSYDDPANCGKELQEWFMEMIMTYPPMNGLLAPSDDDIDEWEKTEDIRGSRVTDYSIGKESIYCAFAWSVANEAYEAVRSLAKKHHVGFFDVSGAEGDIFYNL